MKRVVSWLLILCLILSLMPGIPMTAGADTLSDPNYNRWVCIRWGENGEHEWTAIYNHELQQEETSSPEALPEGVTYESGSITLENANLYSIDMNGWGTIPVHVTVLGENTIACSGEKNNALDFLYCHDVTIDGGGSLTLRSEFVTLRSAGGVAGTGSEENGEETYEASRFVIRDVTIDTENTSSGAGLAQEDGWMQAALSLYCNVLLENADLDIRGHGGLEVNGDLTIRNCTINATGLAYSCRHTIAEDGDDTDAIPSDGLITDSVLNITTNHFNASWMPHTMVIHPAATLTIGDGAEINLDHSDRERPMQALDISGDYLGCGLNGCLRVEGGKLNISADDPDANAIVVTGDWVQTGGEVIVESNILNSVSVLVQEDAAWLQTGGSISLTNTHPDVSVEDGFQSAAMELLQGSKTTMTGGTMNVSGDYIQAIRVQSDLVLGGTELTLDAYDTGLDLYSKANVVMMGGSLDFTAQNQEMSFGVNSVNGAGFTMTGGTLNLHALLGMPSFGGLYRIFGGEANLTSSSALWGGREHFTFGEDIRIAYADGTEAPWEDDFAVNTGWERVSVKSQTVSSKNCVLLPAMFYPNAVVAGTPAPAELIVSLTSPTGTVAVELPEGAELDESGVWVNGAAADYRLTDTGFELTCANGSYVTFQILHATAGEQTLTARAEGLEFPLTYRCASYSFNVPPATHTPTISVSGMAMAGGTLRIHATGIGELDTVTVNPLGTWRTTLTLPEEGTYSLYALLFDPEGNYVTVSNTRTVDYAADSTVLETLTVGNWIHGPTDVSPHEYTSVTFNYIDHTTSSGYYTYWPELPEFDFTAKFKGDTGSPERICNVEAVAYDENGTSVAVPLSYDKETGTWIGKGMFCGINNIIPNRFQVRWENAETGSSGSTGEEESEPRVAVDEDYSTGTVLLLGPEAAGEYRLPLTHDAAVESIVSGLGGEVGWVVEENLCCFRIEAGEQYIVTLSEGGFEQWPEEQELTILVESAQPRRIVEYQDNVLHISSDSLSDWTDSSFVSQTRYDVGDVLLIDGENAVTVTGVQGDAYTYDSSGIDEVFRRLDLSGFTGTEAAALTIGDTEEEIRQRFLESDIYAAYERALEQTAKSLSGGGEFKFELDDDTEVTVTAKGTLEKNTGTVGIEIKVVTTIFTTKLPGKAKQKITVETLFSYEIKEAITYHLRSINDDRSIQSYCLFTDETVTNKFHIRAGIGEESDSGEDGIELMAYFSDALEEEARKNFLEELEGKDDDNTQKPLELIKDVRLDIPIYTGITLYFRPTLDVNWGFFGEVAFEAESVETSRKGVSMVHLGDKVVDSWENWDIRKFTDPNAYSDTAKASLKLHMSAFVYPNAGIAVGLSGLKCLNVELYAKSGYAVSLDGHGTVTVETAKPVDLKAELLVDLVKRCEAGIAGFVSIAKKRMNIDKLELQLWRKDIPVYQWGLGVMPTKFANVEEGPVYVSSECDLGRLIDLRLDCQNFKTTNGIKQESKVLDRDRYSFELISGAGKVTLTSDGKLKVLDPWNEFEFKVKVTYTGFGTGYILWKIVPMKYTPGNITLTKNTPEGPKSCTCLVVDTTPGHYSAREVGVPGEIVIPAINGHTYEITEIKPPSGYEGDDSVHIVQIGNPDNPTAYPEGRAGFFNVKEEDPEPPDPIPIDPIGDPSGFVFEGIESNRLSGVTATLYQADDESGSNARLWDAARYDQQNPLITDLEGKYMWMVPNGWWQVRYELEGYENAESEWMIVPPVRTAVNQNLVTDQPATMSLRYSEAENCPILTFSRPVQVASVKNYIATVDGVEVGSYADPVDAQWSVTEDPMDSEVCATVFRLQFNEGTDLREKTVTLTLPGAVTYYGTIMEELSASMIVPAIARYSANIIGGSGSGIYEVGAEVPVHAEPEPCAVFEYWEGGNTQLREAGQRDTSFRMPDHEVTITAVYRMDHQYEPTVTAPTCTSEGFTTHTCVSCGDSYTDSPTPLTDHSFGPWVMAIAPTVLQTGMEVRTCSHCGHTERRLTEPLGNPFADVPEGSFYYEPVLWAVDRGITNGTTPTTFGPNEQCMRAHVVTFLWRAAGSPEPAAQTNPFVDVKPTDFYFKAVLWALEEGITAGMDATHFGPFSYCNRAQVVTFLHRTMGSPEPADTSNPFTDVPAGQWYTAPVLWAVEKGITNGLSASSFGPNAICNRAQIVTFLCRAFDN